MERKIIKAFALYDEGLRPEHYGIARSYFVLNKAKTKAYPLKVIWALAEGIDNTSSFNTNVAKKGLERLGFELLDLNQKQNKDFDDKVSDLINFDEQMLNQKLEASMDHETYSVVTTVRFNRSPVVVALVLKRAKGICEACNQLAPFKRASDLTPYLEVHHIKPLSQGGKDTVENCIALCPNCHRKKHYG